MKRRISITLLAVLALNLLAQEAAPSFKVQTRKPADKVELIAKNEELIGSVHSSDGIGSATITLVGGTWPAKVTLRLDLRNLEYIQLSDGVLWLDSRLGGEEWTQRDKPVLKSEIRKLHDVIEVVVPASLLSDKTKQLTLKWINEYR